MCAGVESLSTTDTLMPFLGKRHTLVIRRFQAHGQAVAGQFTLIELLVVIAMILILDAR